MAKGKGMRTRWESESPSSFMCIGLRSDSHVSSSRTRASPLWTRRDNSDIPVRMNEDHELHMPTSRTTGPMHFRRRFKRARVWYKAPDTNIPSGTAATATAALTMLDQLETRSTQDPCANTFVVIHLILSHRLGRDPDDDPTA